MFHKGKDVASLLRSFCNKWHAHHMWPSCIVYIQPHMYALTLVRVTTTGTLQRTHVPPADSNNSYGNYYSDVDLNYFSHIHGRKITLYKGHLIQERKMTYFPPLQVHLTKLSNTDNISDDYIHLLREKPGLLPPPSSTQQQ